MPSTSRDYSETDTDFAVFIPNNFSINVGPLRQFYGRKRPEPAPPKVAKPKGDDPENLPRTKLDS